MKLSFRVRVTLVPLSALTLVACIVSGASATEASRPAAQATPVTRNLNHGDLTASGGGPTMVSAQDEGFWLNGEEIVTTWSEPVELVGAEGADSFSMTGALGQPIIGAGASPGSATNQIDVALPLGSETPTQISYTGTGTTTVADTAGDDGVASATPVAVAQSQPQFAGTLSDPIDRDQMTVFGQRSFWLQPWRSYMDTFPATRMLDSVGINFNIPNGQTANVAAAAKLLHDAGFTRARIEIPWSAMDYEYPDQINPTSLPRIANELQQLQANGIRPLILLDSDDQIPTPVQTVTLDVTKPAAKWATHVQLNPASAKFVKKGFTGFAEYNVDAGAIITSVNSSGLATLSQPLMVPIPAGAQREVDLRFQPFFPVVNPNGSKNATNQATLNGWVQYVAGVTQTVKSILGDDNFDVEVWNELTFGSGFLDASGYYFPAPKGSGSVTREILEATVNYIRDSSHDLPDVEIGDGFTNESPMIGGSDEVPGVTAIDKHPYHDAVEFPAQTAFNGVRPVDALGNPAGTERNGKWYDTFVPTFTALFPESFLSEIQTETVIHDLAPFTTMVGGAEHGRYTHPPSAPAPQMWVTEVNLGASSVHDTLTSPDGSATSPMSLADRRHFETKAILRYLSAWVGKGVTQVDFYAACCAGDLDVIDPSFFTAVQSTNGYPGLAAGGETMLAVSRFLGTMAGAQNLSQTQPLTLNSISDYDGAYQFAGNGTANYPPLYNRDVIGFFPFQVAQDKWVIPTYVMTRNLATLYNPSAPATDVTRADLPQEVYSLTIGGVDPDTVTASATDPITGNAVPVKITGRGSGWVSLEIPLTDYPRMLTLQDG